MNERTRQKKARQLKRRAIGASRSLFASAWSFWLIVPGEYVMRPVANFLAGGSDNPRNSHGTVAVGVLGEKITAEPETSTNPLPFVAGPVNVPEPTTLLLLAPAALLVMRRNRQRGVMSAPKLP